MHLGLATAANTSCSEAVYTDDDVLPYNLSTQEPKD